MADTYSWGNLYKASEGNFWWGYEPSGNLDDEAHVDHVPLANLSSAFPRRLSGDAAGCCRSSVGKQHRPMNRY